MLGGDNRTDARGRHTQFMDWLNIGNIFFFMRAYCTLLEDYSLQVIDGPHPPGAADFERSSSWRMSTHASSGGRSGSGWGSSSSPMPSSSGARASPGSR